MTTTLQDRAFDLAEKWHSGQERRFNKLPYIVHPIEVVQQLKMWGMHKDRILAVAYMHDLLEDTDIDENDIKKLFGSNILRDVKTLSKDPDTEKTQYIRDLARKASDYVVVVKLADRISNTNNFLSARKFDKAVEYWAQAVPLIRRLSSMHIDRNVVHNIYKTIAILEENLKTVRLMINQKAKKYASIIIVAEAFGEIKLRNALKHHYDKIWNVKLQEIRKHVNESIPGWTNERISEANFKVGEHSWEGYRKTTYHVSYSYNDNGALFDKDEKAGFPDRNFKFDNEISFNRGKSGNISDIYFDWTPSNVHIVEDEIKKKIEQEAQRFKTRQEFKQKEEGEKLKTLSKPQALALAKQDVLNLDIDVTREDLYDKYERENLEAVAMHWGLDPEELKQYVKNSPEARAEIVRHIKEQKDKNTIIRITLSRLPRFIKHVVQKVPVIFLSEKAKGSNAAAYYKKQTGKIIVYWGTYGGSLMDYVGKLAHEYWHAFEHLSGFEWKIKDKFEKIVEATGLGKGTFEDFEIVVKTIDAFAGEDFKQQLQSFKAGWGKKYFERQQYDALEEMKTALTNVDFYDSMSEILADTLDAVVTNEKSSLDEYGGRSGALSESLLVWMNKKFSSQKVPCRT